MTKMSSTSAASTFNPPIPLSKHGDIALRRPEEARPTSAAIVPSLGIEQASATIGAIVHPVALLVV